MPIHRSVDFSTKSGFQNFALDDRFSIFRCADDEEGSNQTSGKPRARNRAQEELLRQKSVARVPGSEAAFDLVLSTNDDEWLPEPLRNIPANKPLPALKHSRPIATPPKASSLSSHRYRLIVVVSSRAEAAGVEGPRLPRTRNAAEDLAS